MQDNLIATIQYRDPDTKEIKIVPAVPGKSAYQSAVQGGFTGNESDFNQILADLMPKTEIEEKLDTKADTIALNTLKNDYYTGAVISEFSSPRQFPHAGLYHILAMTEEVNQHLEDPGFAMTDYNVGDYYGQLLTSFTDANGGCKFGTLIVTSPRLAKKVWFGRVWEYEIKEWVLLAHVSTPEKYNLQMVSGWLARDGYGNHYSKDQFGQVTIQINIINPQTPPDLTLAAVLPAGYRPSDITVTAAHFQTNGEAHSGVIKIQPDGNLYLGHSISTSDGVTCASQISFYAAN